ncbi:YodB [Bifidobacterium minimum]|uniref:YodB n=1 Tax=Bifidobacterium minimum TaxID=1693 RepID=A0A087BSG8_9BIFI|nr:helix-turn-helix domain-containing protein [Bifidobacterium minimum]KFI73968.1 YodB [Bifidobacterium minimum]
MTIQRPRPGAADGADDRGRPSTTLVSTTQKASDGHPIEACPSFVAAMSIIGQRWSGLIIQALAKGCASFTDISHFAENLSDASLSRRLKQLESEGLIIRTVSQERPVKVRYDLTDAGRALAPVLNDITDWGERFVRHGDVTPPTRRSHRS